MGELEICDCGEIATWLYMPSSESKEHPFYCDKCVPRGCSCNNTSLEEDYAQLEIENYKKNKQNYKIENGEIIPLDSLGRELPCCEYDYDEDGFEI